jgi:hypothetical protein
LLFVGSISGGCPRTDIVAASGMGSCDIATTTTMMMSRLECPALLASMGGGASTGGGLSATGVPGDFLILRLFVCDGSSGDAGPNHAVSQRRDRRQWAALALWRPVVCVDAVEGGLPMSLLHVYVARCACYEHGGVTVDGAFGQLADVRTGRPIATSSTSIAPAARKPFPP